MRYVTLAASMKPVKRWLPVIQTFATFTLMFLTASFRQTHDSD